MDRVEKEDKKRDDKPRRLRGRESESVGYDGNERDAR